MRHGEPILAIPVIDVSAFAASDYNVTERMRVAEEIRHACQAVGFFYVKNHGIPKRHRKAVFEEVVRFFALPMKNKMRFFIAESEHFSGYVPLGWEETAGLKDWHEALDFRPTFPDAHGLSTGPKKLRDSIEWPDEPERFKDVLKNHWGHMIHLGERIARGIAMSLGVDDSFLSSYTKNAFCTMRILHYPEYHGTDPGIGEGIGPHIDYGFLTILDQEGVSGLEVRTADGDWIPVPSIPDTYIVNIGRVMQVWSNGGYAATEHRVRGVKGDRYSLPFFYNPSFDALIEPLSACCSPENPPRYEPYCHGEFMADRLRTAFSAHINSRRRPA